MRSYNLITDDYGLTGRTKLSRFMAYCSIEIIPEIEAQPGYKASDWDNFQVALMRYFFDQDPQQIFFFFFFKIN